MKVLFRWGIAALAIGIAAFLVPGVTVTPLGAGVAAIVLGALNLFVRPILLLLTLPITLVTFGLFSFVINAVLIQLASFLVPGFDIAGFWTALLFAFVIFLINAVFRTWRR